MKTKILAISGLLLTLAILLSGCATGLTPSSWPGMTADDQYVYIAGGPFVYAVNLQTGVEAWRFPEKGSPATPFYAEPVLTPDGQLIVGGFNHKLYSLNPLNGATNRTFEGAHDRWIAAALVLDDMIYAANADYSLYALNMDFELQWTFNADQSIWGAPVSDGRNIYFGTLGRKVYAVNIQSGEQVWVQDLDGAVLGSPVVDQNGFLFVGTYAGTLYSLDTRDGQVDSTVTASTWIWSAPLLDGAGLYFGDGQGQFYVYQADGLQQEWTQALNGAVISTPTLFGARLAVGTESGNVYLVDPSSQTVQPFTVPGKIYARPLVAGSLLLLATTDGSNLLVALDQNGAQKWAYQPAK